MARRKSLIRLILIGISAALVLSAPFLGLGQTEQETREADHGGSRIADGARHGLPVEAFAVVPGTRFLVSLQQELSTKELRMNQEFRVRTLEPLEAG